MSSNNSKGHEKEGDLCFHIKLTSTHVRNANHQRLRPSGFLFPGLSRKRWVCMLKKTRGINIKGYSSSPRIRSNSGWICQEKKKDPIVPAPWWWHPALVAFLIEKRFDSQNAHSFILKMGWSYRIPICFVFWTSFWCSGDQNTMIMIGNRTTCSSFWVMICI